MITVIESMPSESNAKSENWFCFVDKEIMPKVDWKKNRKWRKTGRFLHVTLVYLSVAESMSFLKTTVPATSKANFETTNALTVKTATALTASNIQPTALNAKNNGMKVCTYFLLFLNPPPPWPPRPPWPPSPPCPLPSPLRRRPLKWIGIW